MLTESNVPIECNPPTPPATVEEAPSKLPVIGHFEVDRLGLKSWKIRNTLYGFTYKTYGTWEEVHDALLEQTEAWNRRLGKKGHGDGWRGKMGLERKQCEAAKEKRDSTEVC